MYREQAEPPAFSSDHSPGSHRPASPQRETDPNFDIHSFKRDLMDKFISDSSQITREQEDHKREISRRLDEIERKHE